LLALFAVVGYAYGVTDLHGLPSLTPIALYTAVTLLLLCAGIAMAHAEGVVVEIVNGAGPGSVAARRLLPMSLVGFPILGWVRLEGQRLGLFGTATGAALVVVVSTVVLGLAVVSLTRRLNGVDARRRRAAARETRLAALVDASSEAITSLDRDGLILTWNRAAEEYFGYTADEILGQPVSILSPPDRAEEQRQLIQTVVREGRGTRLDTQQVHKNGQRLDVSVTLARLMIDGELTDSVP
jgi:PAS domain S-box-containing protein